MLTYPVTIDERYLPIFLRGQNLEITAAKLMLRTPVGQAVNSITISLDDHDQTGFKPEPLLGNLWAVDVINLFTEHPHPTPPDNKHTHRLLGDHSFVVKKAGDLAPVPPPGNDAALDVDKLNDVLLYVEYQVEKKSP